jgi:hypothetical protein
VLLHDDTIDDALWTSNRQGGRRQPRLFGGSSINFGVPLSMAYLMPPNSGPFVSFINQWLDLQSSGFAQQMNDYGFRQPRLDDQPGGASL